MQVLGYILIIFAFADFGSSYAGYNLTSFLGEASRYSPILIGLIGGALINFGEKKEIKTPNKKILVNSNINTTSIPQSIRKDLTDELEELQELYEEGTLSEEQFKKAKNKLLK